MTEEEWLEQEERADRISEVKSSLAEGLNHVGVAAFAHMLENDVFVEGPLTKIMEFCQEWRSEIEELG